jgi:hypothetical protein
LDEKNRVIIYRGSRVETAAAPGTIMRGTCGRRTETGTIQTTRTTTTVFDASNCFQPGQPLLRFGTSLTGFDTPQFVQPESGARSFGSHQPCNESERWESLPL